MSVWEGNSNSGTGQLSNKSCNRNNRCTGDCIKVERLACDVFEDPLSSYFKTLWNCSL